MSEKAFDKFQVVLGLTQEQQQDGASRSLEQQCLHRAAAHRVWVGA